LKLSYEGDLNNWFFDREEKQGAVILNDKFISDAFFNSSYPIKAEHSYSLENETNLKSFSPKNICKTDGK